MSLTARSDPDPELPGDIAERAVAYLRYETSLDRDRAEGTRIRRTVFEPLIPFAMADPAAFTRQLAAAVLPVGGEAARGGARLVRDLLGPDFDDPHYHAMLDAGIEWLRRGAKHSLSMASYEWGRWFDTHPPESSAGS